jgi:hypothetical protein
MAVTLTLVLSMLASCGGEGKKPPPDEISVEQQTGEVIGRAADAISSGNQQAFLEELEESLRLQTGGELNLSSPGAPALALGLKNAKVIEVYPDIAFYEMSLDSETYMFYVLREGEEWKIGGL